MSIYPTDLHAAIQAHLDASGESMRALSLRAGLSPKGVSDILHRPGLRPTHRTVALLSTAIGVSLPAPEVGARRTYAELIARLEGADDPSGRSRKMAGRLRWLVRAAGWVAETREVDRGEVIAFFSQNRPATFDLGAGSFATYKSDVLAAIDGGRRRARGRDVRDVGGLHRELHEQVRDCQALPQDLRIVGGAFLVYLHDQGIAPCQVTTEVLAEYHAHRRATGVKDEAACTKHVKRVAALLARLRTLPEFARFAVAAPPHPFADGRLKYGGGDVDAVIAPLMEEFDARVGPWARGEVSSTGLSRAAFVAELDARRAKARPRGKKPLQQRDRRGRRKGKAKLGARAEELRRRGFLLPDERWSERTLANRRAFVAAAAKALVADQDYVIETLEELTDPDTVEVIADVLEEANEGEHASEYVATGVKAIRKIARGLLGRSPEDIQRIADVVADVDPGRHGIAPRNRAKLRAFTEARADAFLNMSDAMLREVNAEVARRRRAARAKGAPTDVASLADAELARQVMLVVAHDVMLVRAPRSANVIEARLEWVRWQDGLATIVVPAVAVKGRTADDPDLAIPLDADQSRLLRRYLDHLRPKALREGDERNPYLFPSPGGNGWRPGRAYGGLLRCLCREVHRRVGVRVHPHLYRHLIGWLWLRDDPRRLPEVSKILGHALIETTAEYYAEVDEELALKHWSEYLNDRRERNEHDRRPARGPRSRRRG